MNEKHPIKVVGYRLKTKLFWGTFIGVVVFFFSLISFSMYRSADTIFKQIFFSIVIIFCIWLAYRQKLAKMLARIFKPAFIIHPNGIKFIDSGFFAEWGQIKEVVVFNFEGEKHFGFRLRDDLTTLQGRDTKECMKGNLDWSVFKMPFATMYKVISTPAGDIIEMLHS